MQAPYNGKWHLPYANNLFIGLMFALADLTAPCLIKNYAETSAVILFTP
jgi:hypothetical protein